MRAIENVAYAGNPDDIVLGEAYLAEGAMGAVILAGGMGTRLGFPHPKGMFPIFPGVSLFEIFIKRTLEASLKAQKPLYLALMTSPENDAETRAFFKSHNFFGLEKSQLFFFTQGTLPMEDDEGHSVGVEAADGNGSVFFHFVNSGIYDEWKNHGISFVNTVLIDNPLADPFDANFLGFHIKSKSDVSVKCVERLSCHEKVGLLVERNGKVAVVEYSEMDEDEKKACLPDGTLKHKWANLSLFCLSMPFIKELSYKEFPLHRAKKPISNLPGSPLAWKKERFIFDLLEHAESPHLIAYPRSTCFAPLKNREGPDSPETVRAALHHKL